MSVGESWAERTAIVRGINRVCSSTHFSLLRGSEDMNEECNYRQKGNQSNRTKTKKTKELNKVEKKT